MDSDLLLVFGLLLGVLSIPALISAFSSDRSLRGGIALAAVGGAMIVAAYIGKPESYRPNEIPHVILSVIARIVR